MGEDEDISLKAEEIIEGLRKEVAYWKSYAETTKTHSEDVHGDAVALQEKIDSHQRIFSDADKLIKEKTKEIFDLKATLAHAESHIAANNEQVPRLKSDLANLEANRQLLVGTIQEREKEIDKQHLVITQMNADMTFQREEIAQLKDDLIISKALVKQYKDSTAHWYIKYKTEVDRWAALKAKIISKMGGLSDSAIIKWMEALE